MPARLVLLRFSHPMGEPTAERLVLLRFSHGMGEPTAERLVLLRFSHPMGEPTAEPPLLLRFSHPMGEPTAERLVGERRYLQDDDSAGRGKAARPHRREDRSGIQRKVGPERFTMIGEPSPIRNRVGHEEDDDVDGRVTRLQADAAIESLNIDQTRLRLHADDDTAKSTLAVPGPEIAGDRHRNLGPPNHGIRKLAAESLEEMDLARVSDRISIRIGAAREPQPDRGASHRELGNRDIRQLGSFNPPECRFGDADGRGDGPDAQPVAATCLADLAGRGSDDACPLFSASVHPTFTSRHFGSMRHGAYLLINAPPAELPRNQPSGASSWRA